MDGRDGICPWQKLQHEEVRSWCLKSWNDPFYSANCRSGLILRVNGDVDVKGELILDGGYKDIAEKGILPFHLKTSDCTDLTSRRLETFRILKA